MTDFLLKLFLLFFLVFPLDVQAANSCTATVSPSSVMTSTVTNFNFSITNTGSNNITTVVINRPSDNFAMENYGVPGWNINANNSFAELTGGSISPGATFNFSYYATSGSSEASSSNWSVQANDGSGLVNCAGSLGTAIAGQADRTAPEISNITISDITNISATISWTTDESSTSNIDYGTTEDHGSNQSDATMTTAHSLSLTGLSTNTTYYYMISSTDSGGNTTQIDQNSFTTASIASPGVTTTIQTVTHTVTKTETKTEIKTNTKIIEIRDTLPPVVSVTTDFEKPFEQPPEISGRSSDASRIATVEYSIDGGENWLPVDEIMSPGKTSTEFRFVPAIFDDGNYEIKVRAIDGAGNQGFSKSQTLIIDRLPPLIGASLFTLGPLILYPDKNGAIVTTVGVEQKVTLSAAGGPVTIDLFANNTMYSLVKSVETGLWSGRIKFNSPGNYEIKYTAVDGGGNVTKNNLVSVIVVDTGQVIDKKNKTPIKNAKVSLYQKDSQTGEWYSWDGAPFNQASPQLTNDKGIYSYFLPQGQYYFRVGATEYEEIFSQIFDITIPTPINTNFFLTKKTFPIQFGWEKIEVSINIPETSQEKNNLNSLSGKIVTDFISLRGKPAVVTFLNSWSPSSIDQITILDSIFKKEGKRINFEGVAVQEKSSKIEVFAKRGGYEIPFLSDPDGTLAQKFSAINLPTHVFLDRKGTVLKILSGVLTEEDLLSNF